MRITTGIPNFEKLVEGGIPRGSTVLVQGEYGTGKTTFALQYIVKGLTAHDEFGALISFVDDREDLLMDAKMYGFPVKRFEKIGTLKISGSSSIEREGRELVERILDTVEEEEADRLAIDGMSRFRDLFEDESDFKKGMHELKRKLREAECTTVITGGPDSGIEEIVDGVVILHYEGGGLERTRAMEIRKMRRTEHTSRLCPFEITREGINVTGYPEEKE
ncbi:hypothetical protein AKJ39_00335 [candidate division MSBL1 archaeon SCGC-AAA259J03]|uniref:KaiC domain-containing protein n=1 Tax=candidate division MSBL1 archaeon SCGC-AAA259J03 TaxID=1698269 RepID=A0A656YXG3_9EURY|nr:hypothetical protein AKJ39_00335 [candidate division MSBL1 archaeon SCGC-AAA259J03]